MNLCKFLLSAIITTVLLTGTVDSSVTIDEESKSRTQDPNFDIETCKTYYILKTDTDVMDLKLRIAHKKLQTLLEGDSYALKKAPIGESDIIVDVFISHDRGMIELPERTFYYPVINYGYNSTDAKYPTISRSSFKEDTYYLQRTTPVFKTSYYYTGVFVNIYKHDINDDSQSENVVSKNSYIIVYEGSCIGYSRKSDYQSALNKVLLFALPLNKAMAEEERIILERQKKEQQDKENTNYACTSLVSIALIVNALYGIVVIIGAIWSALR